MNPERLKSLLPATGDVPQELARDTDRVNRRRELIAALPPGGTKQLQAEDHAGTEWLSRGYWLQWPFLRHGAAGNLVAQIAQASRDIEQFDAVTLLSGIYKSDTYEPPASETYEDTKQKSVLGYVGVRVRAYQYKNGSSGIVLVGSTDGFQDRQLHYVVAHRGGGSHFLYTQKYMFESSPTLKQGYCHREGMLDLPGSDIGCWEQQVDTVVFNAAYDYRYPFIIEVDADIRHGLAPFSDYPRFLDPRVATELASDPTDPTRARAGNMYVNCLGFSAWGY